MIFIGVGRVRAMFHRDMMKKYSKFPRSLHLRFNGVVRDTWSELLAVDNCLDPPLHSCNTHLTAVACSEQLEYICIFTPLFCIYYYCVSCTYMPQLLVVAYYYTGSPAPSMVLLPTTFIFNHLSVSTPLIV